MTRQKGKWFFPWLAAVLLLASGCSICTTCSSSSADSIPSVATSAPSNRDLVIVSSSTPPAEKAPNQPIPTPPPPVLTKTLSKTDNLPKPLGVTDDADLLPVKTADPAAMQKRIVVDISEQRVYAYENNRIVFFSQASTGRNHNTAVGTFKILDKKLRPYSDPWGFWMPHWMGIYWVAGMENGFHAPPVLENGQAIWEDQIGTPATNGCIMLLPEDMEKLYHWSEVGTAVEIVE